MARLTDVLLPTDGPYLRALFARTDRQLDARERAERALLRELLTPDRRAALDARFPPSPPNPCRVAER